MNRAGWRFHGFVSRTLNELKSGAPLVSNAPPPPRKLAQPVELSAMVGRLTRAGEQQKGIAEEGKRLDTVQDAIDARLAEITGYRGDLEEYHNKLKAKIDGMVAGSNQPPEGAGGNDGGASPGGEQPEDDKPKDADGDSQGR